MKYLKTMMMALMMCSLINNDAFARKTRSDKGGHHKSGVMNYGKEQLTLLDSANLADSPSSITFPIEISNNGYEVYITSPVNKTIVYDVNGKIHSIKTSSSIIEKNSFFDITKDTIKIDPSDINWYNRFITFKIISIDSKEPHHIIRERLKLEIETENSNRVLYLSWTLVILIILIPIVISKIKKVKSDKLKIIEEKTWASPDGVEFSEKLIKMIHNNESCRTSDHSELKDLSVINQETINKKFDVKPGKKSSRIWFLLLMLNDRYVAENDELEFIDEQEALRKHSINLSKDEVLYRTFTDAAWYELKRNAQTVGIYHVLGLKIPLGGGFSYRLGAIQNLNPQYSEDYKVVSEGTVFLTNKRIIFQGESQNKTININSLLDIDLYSDSVILGKTTGKKPLIKFDLDDSAVFSRILSRVF